jgi:hypothetical protein
MTAMPKAEPTARDLRRKIQQREHVSGTSIKIPTFHSIEIVGLVDARS